MSPHRSVYNLLSSVGLRLVEGIETSFRGRLFVLGVLVGIAGGLGAVAFQYLLIGVTALFFAGATSQAALLERAVELPWYYRVLAPAIGGAIVGLIASYSGGGLVRGEGVPEVIEAIERTRGRLPLRVVPAKAVASAVCIGSGGATGREGPIVQIGGTIGAAVGNRLDLPDPQTSVLLAAGAGAGLGGTFNAPIGGMIFAWEVLLGRVTRENVPPVAIAAVVGTATANVIVGLPDPIFSVPPISIESGWEGVAYVGLGVVGAAVALAFANSLYAIEHGFERLPVPTDLKPALGGLCLGVIALSIPQVYGVGYPVIQDALVGGFVLEAIVAFGIAKIVATSLTLGSGGSGGIFAPTLYVGAMAGTVYGTLLDQTVPVPVADPTTYAAVGMGAVFAGASHAPLTAIVVVYELTGDVWILPPLAIACLISAVLSRRASEGSIYTIGLLERGVEVDSRRLF
ncbi:chloride channel protein [Natronobeatus ordinarius]|uniref:chloride channel protein n=1 Tax=Natronobeatus ordinarius TaxID=2963433 RepID=UPI0020CF257D|nr:chloride channel protein [Natronobeatus ordinarius]